MKTKFQILLVCFCALYSQAVVSQSNYTATIPSNQDLIHFGLINGYTTVNVATDESGNGYVLSSDLSDSSIWVTKYDANGTQVFNTRVGVVGYETLNKYAAKRIRVYGNRIYVLATTRFYNIEGTWQNVYCVDKNTGIVEVPIPTFITPAGYTSSELVDLIVDGNTVFMVGNCTGNGGPGSTKIEVMKSDLTWTGNLYVLGNDASTDYYINSESTTSLTLHQNSIYITGVANYGGSLLRILVGKMNGYGMWTEYKYVNSSYLNGGTGLSIAAEGGFVYASGALRARNNQPFKSTVLKIDTTLSSLAWIDINKNAAWPIFIKLGSGNQVYTVNEQIKVIGLNKSNGKQLFSKNDFKMNNVIYTYPVGAAVLSNGQLMIQGSISASVNGNATQNKVILKYSATGSKVFQQAEPLSLISPGNPEFADGLGLAYATAVDFSIDVYRKNTASGQHIYVSGRATPSSLRVKLEDSGNLSGISLYPNPAHDFIKIKSTQKIVHWIVYDSAMRVTIQSEADANEIEINCSALEAGIYFIRAITEEGDATMNKMIIDR